MRVEIDVHLDRVDEPIGLLVYSQEGQRESCQFKYTDSWMASDQFFALCPQLPKQSGFATRGKKDRGSVFFDCFADTEPNGWGKKVILRDVAHQRQDQGKDGVPAVLNSLDFLLWVDDFARQGALRFRDKSGCFLRDAPPERRKTPPVLSFSQLLASSRAVELNKDTRQDLEYLRGRGSDLDGMRPKCTVIDTDGTLCLAKFPSVGDTRPVTHAEMLAIEVAKASGIRVQDARLIDSDGVPVVLIKRFDRAGTARKMYLSAASLFDDFEGVEDHAYTEFADVIRTRCASVTRDMEEMWRRMVFNILIKNVDDHLHNHGFLHVKKDKWELAPAFDINPFPEKQHVLKLWISEDSGLSGEMGAALSCAPRFGIEAPRAKVIVQEVVRGTGQWQVLARKIGLKRRDIDELAPAFEHRQRDEAVAFASTQIAQTPVIQPPEVDVHARTAGQRGG